MTFRKPRDNDKEKEKHNTLSNEKPKAKSLELKVLNEAVISCTVHCLNITANRKS